MRSNGSKIQLTPPFVIVIVMIHDWAPLHNDPPSQQVCVVASHRIIKLRYSYANDYIFIKRLPRRL